MMPSFAVLLCVLKTCSVMLLWSSGKDWDMPSHRLHRREQTNHLCISGSVIQPYSQCYLYNNITVHNYNRSNRKKHQNILDSSRGQNMTGLRHRERGQSVRCSLFLYITLQSFQCSIRPVTQESPALSTAPHQPSLTHSESSS